MTETRTFVVHNALWYRTFNLSNNRAGVLESVDFESDVSFNDVLKLINSKYFRPV